MTKGQTGPRPPDHSSHLLSIHYIETYKFFNFIYKHIQISFKCPPSEGVSFHSLEDNLLEAIWKFLIMSNLRSH